MFQEGWPLCKLGITIFASWNSYPNCWLLIELWVVAAALPLHTIVTNGASMQARQVAIHCLEFQIPKMLPKLAGCCCFNEHVTIH